MREVTRIESECQDIRKKYEQLLKEREELMKIIESKDKELSQLRALIKK